MVGGLLHGINQLEARISGFLIADLGFLVGLRLFLSLFLLLSDCDFPVLVAYKDHIWAEEKGSGERSMERVLVMDLNAP